MLQKIKPTGKRGVALVRVSDADKQQLHFVSEPNSANGERARDFLV
jgi:hypothetical protein